MKRLACAVHSFFELWGRVILGGSWSLPRLALLFFPDFCIFQLLIQVDLVDQPQALVFTFLGGPDLVVLFDTS